MTQARPAAATVAFVDDYCQLYEDVFPDVRSFEHFKHLQVGMLSEIKRKTLPAIARATGESDAQALHHFVAYARRTGGRAANQTAEQAEAGTGGKSVYPLH
jgi:SRSO17 transposase